MVKRTKKNRWLFPTNTNNLRMIFAQGLLTSPKGFSKYYQDALQEHEGYLPLCKDTVPEKYLTKATAEAEHLTPCLLEFDLSKVSGEVKALIKGNIETDKIDTIINHPDIEKLFLLLPIPLGCISKAIFKNKDDIKNFREEVDLRSNVILGNLKLQSTIADSKLFKPGNSEPDLIKNTTDLVENLSDSIDATPDFPLLYAYGGMLTLLFYYAKNGAMSHSCFESFSRERITKNGDKEANEKTAAIHSYFYDDFDRSPPLNILLGNIIDACLKSNNYKNDLVDSLRNAEWSDGQEKHKERSIQMANDLHEYSTNSSKAVSEWFANAKSDIEKVLLMLFTREDTDSLINYENDNLSFSEDEYILFALFFGVRDGFIKMPEFLRKYNNLQDYISYKMALYAHKKMGDSISFSEPKLPLTIWQYVDKKLSKANVKFLGIQPSVCTVMPKAGFKHDKGKNIYEGYIEPSYQVIEDSYSESMTQRIIDENVYNKLK